ncbi:MAG: hypothetical protein CL609_11365 [Anaerolineaceae bacterium]|nr:hypothetical protein [Anaerolineaceae bacterium]
MKKTEPNDSKNLKISPLVLLNLIPEAFFILDSEHTVLFKNEAAKFYLTENNRLEIELKIGWSRSVSVLESNGEPLPMDIWVGTVIWEETSAFLVLMHDVRHYQELNDTLKHNEERYRMISEVISDYACSVRYEPDGSVVWEWETRPYKDIVGYTLEEMIAMGGSLSIIPPEDWGVTQRRSEMNKKGLSDVSEYRIILPDGNIRWLRDYSKPVLKNGKIVRIYGATQDITERKQAEQARDQLLRRLDTLHQLEQKILSTYSAEQISAFTLEKIRQFSTHFAANMVVFDNHNNEKINMAIYEDHLVKLVETKERIENTPLNTKLLKEKLLILNEMNQTERDYYLGKHLNDRQVDFFMIVPFIAHSELIGFISLLFINTGQPNKEQLDILVEISNVVALGIHNVMLYQHVQKLATTDVLTGLNNRRLLREKLEEEIETAKRTNNPLSILLFDVDDFKQVNDLYGHQVGDRLLMELSSTVKKFLRKNDLAVRYGGEEFLILLPGLSITEAQQRAEQIRKAVQLIRIPNKGHLIKPITITIGIATFPYHGQIYRELLQSADLALYQGKNQGKNCVVIANVSFEDAIRNHYESINKDQNE